MIKNYFELKKEQLKNLTSSFNIKAFLNVLGSIIIYMVFGSLYTWSNINIYLNSRWLFYHANCTSYF